jgi:hypothetical protein
MNTNLAQFLMDGLSDQWQRERSESQMTLGKFIERLKELRPEMYMQGLENPHSYRGYYCDLAFERTDKITSVKEVLELCQNAMGEIFHGWKGGEYAMNKNTLIWVSIEGCTGSKIMSVTDGGLIEISKDLY